MRGFYFSEIISPLSSLCFQSTKLTNIRQCIVRFSSSRMAAEAANKKAEREALRGVIQQWNANRLDLFELSEPNEVLGYN